MEGDVRLLSPSISMKFQFLFFVLEHNVKLLLLNKTCLILKTCRKPSLIWKYSIISESWSWKTRISHQSLHHVLKWFKSLDEIMLV